MNMNKIGVIGSFAAGAAFALAPLAAAEEPATPPDFGNLLQGQVQSMNWLFETQASLSGVADTDITKGVPTEADPLQFSTITKDNLELPANNDFAALLYGSNWADEMSTGDSGSYSLFNGALVQFTDANNVLLYALLSGGGEIDAANYGDYLFGGDASIVLALGGDGFLEDASNFYTNAFNDMLGYFAPLDVTP